MRDPNRIDKVLAEIGVEWKKCPDLRLGQILDNSLAPDQDIFLIEDEFLIKKVQDLMKEEDK